MILVLIEGRVQAVHTFRRQIGGPDLHGARVSRMYGFALENAECQKPVDNNANYLLRVRISRARSASAYFS